MSRCVAASLLLALTTLGTERPAYAWGPGLHAREAIALADELAASDPEWAAVFADPGARDALVLGSVTPDFRQVVDALPFGHLRTLGYHLIDVSVDGTPQQRAFALGYLAHVVSDNTADTFVGPGLWTMYALGPFDIVLDEPETLVAETELICETFGDLVNGDWHAVVDALVTYRNGGDAGRAQLDALIGWYCAEAVNHTGIATDCVLARAQLETVLLRVDDLIGSFTRSGAHALIDVLLDQAPVDLMPLFTGGALSSLLGDTFAMGPHSAAELRRFEDSVLVTEEFWAHYDEYWAALAPTLTRVQLERRADGWPRRHNNALRGGNWISAFRHLDPAWWGDGGGLVVESVAWEIGGEEARMLELAEVPVAGVATVFLFATRPFSGSIHVKVHGDLPGLDLVVADGLATRPVYGEAGFELDLDPTRSVDEGLTRLDVAFDLPEDADLDGLVIDVAVAGERAFFQGNAEPLLTQPSALPMWQPHMRRLLTTYGDWPGSLPSDAVRGLADLVVAVRVTPDGDGIAGASVVVGSDHAGNTATHGLAVLRELAPQPYDVTVEADGYRTTVLRDVVVPPGRSDLDVFLTPALDPTAPPFSTDAQCIQTSWNGSRWGSTLPPVHSRVADADGAPMGSETAHGRIDPVRACTAAPMADGTVVRVEVQARPPGVEPTEWEATDAVVIDTSIPLIVDSGIEVLDGFGCVESEPAVPPVSVWVMASDPHSGIASASVEFVDAAGTPVHTMPMVWDDGVLVARTDAPMPDAARFRITVKNGAGLTDSRTANAPVVHDLCAEPEPEPHDAGGGDANADAADSDVVADVADVYVDTGLDTSGHEPAPQGSGRGCSAGSTHSPWFLTVVAAFLVFVRRRGLPHTR